MRCTPRVKPRNRGIRARVKISYVLPLRWPDVDPDGIDELTGYLRDLHKDAEMIVVDGSPREVFDAHARAWGHLVRHMPPDPAHRFANGKVNGVHTGVAAATHDHVVLADDDVRHTPGTLAAIDRALCTASVVRPQNYFDPRPWHAGTPPAAWSTGRSAPTTRAPWGSAGRRSSRWADTTATCCSKTSS